LEETRESPKELIQNNKQRRTAMAAGKSWIFMLILSLIEGVGLSEKASPSSSALTVAKIMEKYIQTSGSVAPQDSEAEQKRGTLLRRVSGKVNVKCR